MVAPRPLEDGRTLGAAPARRNREVLRPPRQPRNERFIAGNGRCNEMVFPIPNSLGPLRRFVSFVPGPPPVQRIRRACNETGFPATKRPVLQRNHPALQRNALSCNETAPDVTLPGPY